MTTFCVCISPAQNSMGRGSLEGLNSTSATSATSIDGPGVEFSMTVASLGVPFGALGFLGFLAGVGSTSGGPTVEVGPTSGVVATSGGVTLASAIYLSQGFVPDAGLQRSPSHFCCERLISNRVKVLFRQQRRRCTSRPGSPLNRRCCF